MIRFKTLRGMDMEEDLKLINNFRQGNRESFEKLVIKYRKNSVTFCETFVHDYYTAEDIVQESFAYIYVYIERYNEKYSFKTYLFTILRNKSIDFIRKKAYITLDEINEPVSCDSIEDTLLKKEQINMVRRKLNELKEDYRTVIYLIDFYDFSYADAAKIMKKSLVQTKILIYRARQKLKLLLKGGYEID